MLIPLVAGSVIMLGGMGAVIFFMFKDRGGLQKAAKYFANRQYDEAQKIFEKAFELDPLNFDCKWYLARIYEMKRQFQKATKMYSSLIGKKSPTGLYAPLDVHAHLIDIYIKLNDLKNAEHEAEVMIVQMPDNSAGYIKLSEIAIAMGDITKATGALRKALVVQPNDAKTLRALGLCYASMHKPEEASEMFRRYLAEIPTDSEVLYHMGKCMRERGRTPEALKYFQRASTDPEWRGKAQLEMGLTYAGAGNMQSAVAILQEAIRSPIEDREQRKEALYILGQSRAANGNLNDAYRYWEEIYAIDPRYKDVAAKLANFKSVKDNQEIATLVSLPDSDFKDKIGEVVERMGYKIKADISVKDRVRFVCAFREEKKIFDAVIEAAKWANPIGEINIRELVKLVKENRAYIGIYISPTTFTEAALKATETYPINLIDGEQLKKYLKRAGA